MCSSNCMWKLTTVGVFLLSMGALIAALLTDHWYQVMGGGDDPEDVKVNNYHFGLFRRCYKERPALSSINPTGDAADASGDDCVYIYRDLVPNDEGSLHDDEIKRIHLMRSVVGLSVTASVFILFCLIVMMCGWISTGNPKALKKIYMASLVFVILAFLAAAGSGVCFMIARRVEEDDLDMYVDQKTKFLWSFMLHWIGAGLDILGGCFVLFLMCHTETDTAEEKGEEDPK